MFKYQGFDYSLEQVTEAADNLGLTVDEYVNKHGLETVEVTDEIQTDPTEGKTSDVAVVDAAVTSEPDTASESTELDSVDTSGELQPGEQGYYRQEKRKEKEAKEQVELDNKNKLKQLTSNLNEYDRRLDSIINTKYGKVNPENLATQASVDLYNNLIEKRNNTIKEIDNIEFEQPSILKSYAAQVGRGFANFAKGLSQFQESIQYSLLETALDVFEPDYKGTAEEKQAIIGVIKQGMPTIGGAPLLPPSSAAGKFIEKLEPAIRQYEDITITEEIKEGNYLKAGERAVGAALESIPSLVAAFTGPGGLIALAGSVSGQKFDEEFKKDPDKSTGVLLSNSVGSGIIEASFELVTRGILKKARLLKDSGADKAARDLIRGGSEKLATTLGLNTLKEGGSEAATKVTTLLFDNLTLDRDVDWGKEVYNIVDEGIVGGIMGSGTTLAGSIANTDQAIVERAQTILMPYENKQEIIKSANKISQLFSDKLKTNAEGIIIINEAIASEEAKIQNIRKETNESLYNMTPAELKVYASNQNDLSKLRQQIQDPKQTESVKKIAEQKFKDIRDQNDVLFRESADRRIQRGIELAKKTAEDITGLEIKDFNTTAEVEAFIKEQDPEADVKASEQQGFIIQNPETGEQTIVINKEVASAEKAVTVSDHELLHSILYKTVKNSPETSVNLGESLLEELNKIDPTQVKDSNFKKRMEQYADQTQEVQMEEALTLFSDAIGNGDIQFNENIFTRIGDSIRRIMQRFGVKVKFNKGRDVYNFIKDYNKSLKSGAISKAQIKAAETGVEGELVTPAERQADEQIIKESRSEEASNRVQEIYDEQGEAGVFDIIEQFKPITSRIVERRSEAPGFDRQLLTDEIETGQRGIIDLIKEYDPESGVPLAAYINKFLPARAIEASKRVLGEEFTEDVTEARGIAAEEVVTETAIKPEAKAIDPFRIMPDVKETAIAEVQKSIADKNVDVTTVTYKELKDVAPYQTVADFFNIPVSRIKNPKDNLRKSDDVANIQRWILKNEPTLKNLFTEANRDVIEVTEGNRVIRQGGEPTAIPRNLLNKFYTKGDRVGNNFQWKLKPYDRTIFLEAVGIKDGKVDPNFTPRASEAQTIKGILDMYTRNLGNVAARDIIEGREDIAPAEKARAKAEVAKGKPRIMLSKAAKQAAVNEINQFIEKQEFVKTGDELAAENKVWKFIAKQLEIIPISSKNASDVVEFQQWIKNVLAPRIDKSFFTTGTFANAGASAAKRNFYFTSAQELNDLLKDVKFGTESKNIQQAVNRKTYVTGGAEGVVSKKFVKEFNSPEFKKEQQEKLDGLKEVFTVFQELMQEDSNNTKFVIALLTSTSQGMGHFVRTSAPVKFYSKNIEGGIVEEHTMPASLVAKYLFGQAVNGTIDQGFKPIENNYFQGALSKNDDKKLKGKKPDGKPFNYTSMTPEGWTLNDNIWARYFNINVATNNFGIDPNNIVLSTGKTVFETYGVNNSGGLVSNNFNTEQQRAAQVNNNKVPKNFRVMASKSMPNVLNNMSNLDTDAKQANKQFYDSLDLNKEFNDILEVKTGIASEKRYKRVKAEVVGANKGRFQFFIPPSAEDFTGLLYSTLAKGKLGDAQMAWYKKNLLDPYGKAMNELSSARIAMMNDYKALKKELKLVPKDLRKKVPGEPFTQEQAVRVYIWQKQGMSVPGISESDMQDLSDFVEGKEDLKTFADQLMYIQKGDQYAGPKEGWPAGTITTDMLEGLNTTKRAKALEQWQANADEIFSEANLNKLEAAYGKPYRKAMENMLQRMKSGRNRNFQGDTLTGRFTDWVTGSIGTIMFFNTRSALLQTISSINFINFTDNNVLAAGKAFANQKQFWSDFMTLMNSDFLKERRGGLRINVSEADIADMAKKGGARGVINKLLEFGFTPTQIADSFAIASGGATFYRNRIKTLKKQGMTDTEAEAQAFVDFRETAEESQQSSRPDRISMQQAGPLGRLVLAFANTPAQYARLIKKAASDLKNGRGDAKTNISKIIYYGVAQNLLFNALQQALFAFAFDDDEEDTDEQQKKYVSIANGMMDSLLRGMGIGGAAISVGKNSIKRIIDEMEKKQPKLEKVGYELTKLSPPISAKLSRINQAARSYQWDKKDMMEKGWSLDNPAYLAGANVISALTNIPLDRAVKKTNNVVQATSQDLETWERLALLGGWQDWEIGIETST